MKKTALFEIFLIITLSVAFSYIVAETNQLSRNISYEEGYVSKAREMLIAWLSKGMVSAQLYTCLENVNGTTCQEYPSEICDSVCSDNCFPDRRENFAECKLGTCFDPSEGTCSASTPKFTCESSGGQWTDAEEGIPAQCTPGCCLLNGNAEYTTETTCNVRADRQGINIDGINNLFDPTVSNELECIVLSEQQQEGACVLDLVPEENKFNCEFLSKSECLGKGGDFNQGLLCSNPELNTVCERQDSTSCVDGEDGLYWIDSCGNKENIYDSNRVRSWNNGEVLPIKDSCSLEQGNNPLGNQNRCGNCNYLTGSICGTPGEDDKHIIDKNLGDFVCRDLSCVDQWGDERKNGESWCAFDSQIGIDNEGTLEQRSVDLPGSGHYRFSCLNGEIIEEPCADFRGEVCSESRDENIGFSSASCRINSWQICAEANTDAEKLNNCEESSSCILHRVDVDDFEFDVCVPRHPPGFDLKANFGGEVGEGICSLASQTCTAIEVKKLSGWKCEVNCDCLDEDFAEQMNNLCISLGDCGGDVNLAGKYSDYGYSVTEDDDPGKKVTQEYINSLKEYAEAKKGQKVKPLTNKELSALFGVPEATFSDPGKMGDFLGKIGLGATGTFFAISCLTGGCAYVFASGLGYSGLPALIFDGAGSILGSFGGAAAGAAAGAAIGFILGKAFGLQGDAMNLIVITSAISGGVLGGIAFAQGVSSFASLFTSVLLPTIIIALIIVLVVKLLGIGKTREIEVSFSCMPWQPPLGGDDCNLCNNDPLGCSKYKCQSLGQTCEFINEGTSDELCVDVSPDDVSAPIIKPWENASGDNLRYSQISEFGFTIESTQTEDNCLQEFTPINYGLMLNEPGQCKIEAVHTNSYEDMDSFFGNSNLFKVNHATTTIVPSLDSLGVPGSNSDPSRRSDYELFVRCQDSSGNANIREYAISMCISPADDLTPPIIRKFIPENPGYAGAGIEQKPLQFYTNEPAECKWSLEDKSYELMENPSICNNNLNSGTSDGWKCNTVLNVTENEEQDYYFRCIDKPWLGEDDDESNDNERNANTQSMIYKVIKTTEELKISSVKPNNQTISVARDPAEVNLEIKTSGGVDGKAYCEFSLNQETYFDFFTTGGTTHKQTLNLFEGDYNIGLQCTDIAENVATATSQFTLEVDDDLPIVSNVYNLNGVLTVITNEPSQCSYDITSCGFNFEDGTLMSGSGYSHTTSIENGITYRIKCKDQIGNVGACFAVQGGY